MNALELHGLEKHYPDFALGPIDLELPGGTVCGLIGENGAGKSTTIKLILDMIDGDAGTVKLFGQEGITPLAKADIGVVLGGEGIPTCLTAPQVGKVMAGIYPNWDATAYADWCRRFDLPENKKYGDYSTGMKMKQCLAVALSHHPKLLLLDEATSGLDPVVRDELIDLLLDFVRDENHAILISSHIVSDLEKLCDTIAFLHKGKLLLCEDKDTLREEYALWHGTAGQLEELDKKRHRQPSGDSLRGRGTGEERTCPGGQHPDTGEHRRTVRFDGERGECAMKGLLLKDWYQVRTNMKTMYLTVAFVLVIWVFSTSNAYVFPVSYAAIFLGILPVNLLTYDQSVGWVEYGRTLPVSKKTLVAEKYLIGLFCAAAAVVIGGLFVTVIPLRTGTAPDEDALSLLAGSVCAILLINGISLPLLYRFGAEKARMIYVLTFAGLGALLGGGGAVMDELQQNGTGSGPLPVPLWLAAVLLLAVLALYAVSWRVSVAWYGKYKK